MLVTDFSRFEALSSGWQRWTNQDPQADIFQHWHWIRAFYSAYSGAVSLFAPVVYHGDKLIGVLPLVRKDHVLEFLGSPESDYNDLISERGNAPWVLQAALEMLLDSDARVGWESMILENLPAYSRIVSSLAKLPPRLRSHLQPLVRCQSPTILLDENKTAVLDALMNKDQLKRYDRKLRKLGRVTFRHIETRDEAREHLGHFFRQHINRCAMNGTRSQFLQPDRRKFYEALIQECDLQTHLRFAVLELDGRPVAYHFGLQFNGKFTWYKPAFDVDYWDYSPGDVLLLHLFRYARESDVREFDFSVGNEPFKFRFANHVKQNYVLYVERQPAQLQNRVQKAVRYATAAARQEPAVRSLFKNGASAAAGAMRRLESVRDIRGLWDGLRELLRKTVWASEEVLFFSLAAKPVDQVAGLQVTPATLAALAAICAECPGALDPTRLYEWRKR